MSENKIRTITLYKDYFSNFYKKQKQKVKDKILWTFRIIETQQQIPTDYFKYMEGTEGLFEIRVKELSKNKLHILACSFAIFLRCEIVK